MIHNGDAEGVVHMPRLHPNVHLVTLAPHVATFAGARLPGIAIDWMLPLAGHRPSKPCNDAQLVTCLQGFAIQGNMDSRRRNYTLIWAQMEERLAASADLRKDGRFLVNVVGSGSPKKLEVRLTVGEGVGEGMRRTCARTGSSWSMWWARALRRSWRCVFGQGRETGEGRLGEGGGEGGGGRRVEG